MKIKRIWVQNQLDKKNNLEASNLLFKKLAEENI